MSAHVGLPLTKDVAVSRTKKAALGLGILGLAVGAALPTTAWASHQFRDVPTDTESHSAVDYLVGNGITKGCDSSGTLFCPAGNVTRNQMALFLERLSGNGQVAPSVNAATVGGKTAEQLQGVQGPAGPAGATGATGATGARGPSDGFYDAAGDRVSLTSDGTEVVSQEVPGDGLFLTTAKTVVANDGTGPVDVSCGLGGSAEDDVDLSVVTVQPGEFATLSLAQAFHTPVTGLRTISVVCLTPDGAPVSAFFASISSSQVGDLTVVQPVQPAQAVSVESLVESLTKSFVK